MKLPRRLPTPAIADPDTTSKSKLLAIHLFAGRRQFLGKTQVESSAADRWLPRRALGDSPLPHPSPGGGVVNDRGTGDPAWVPTAAGDTLPRVSRRRSLRLWGLALGLIAGCGLTQPGLANVQEGAAAVAVQGPDELTLSSAVDSWAVLTQDPRLQPPRSLDSYFPFSVPPTLEAWAQRKAKLQDRLRTVLGLNPEPPRHPLHAIISPPLAMDGYTVAKVRFESLPGFFVTGNLYRPLEQATHDSSADSAGPDGVGRRPAVLCPHGHWSRGRLMYASDEEVQRELASGAEQHECGARSPLQARCVHLARMGCVVFHYDMLGNADSVQIPAAVAHGFARQRPQLNAADAWGLFSVRAESHFQSIMGLQTWNTIRSLDFLETLPDVDPEKIAVTGASGGGTQTFIVAAIDPRPAVVFPAVMVGTAMQGGCVCENCSFLRVENGNVEFAALFAPKPQGLTAADDWTKEMESKGFPELQQLYQLYGAGDQVELTSRLEFGHNYNQVGRQALYRLVGKHFGLPDFPERPFSVLRDQDLSWLAPPSAEENAEAPPTPDFSPETGEAFEVALLQQLRTASATAMLAELAAIVARGADVNGWLADWRTRLRGIYLGSDYSLPVDLQWHAVSEDRLGPYERRQWLLVDSQSRQAVPVVVYRQPGTGGDMPEQAEQVCLYLGNAADDVLDSEGRLKPWAVDRVQAGQRLLCVDLIGQGRFISHAGFNMADRWQMTQREAAGYVMGYNLPLVSQRAQDILQVLAKLLPPSEAELKSDLAAAPSVGATEPAVVDVIAEGDGVPALTVSTLAWDSWGGSKSQVVIDGRQRARLRLVELRGSDFRFVDVPSLRDPNFLPGAAVVGDLPGFWLLNRVPQVRIDSADASWQRVNRVRHAVGAPPLELRP